MLMTGYIVGETEKAVALVRDSDVKAGVKPMWLPRKKIAQIIERDVRDCAIETANGRKIGLPVLVDVDDEFLARIGVS